jgi:hypothetical protein
MRFSACAMIDFAFNYQFCTNDFTTVLETDGNPASYGFSLLLTRTNRHSRPFPSIRRICPAPLLAERQYESMQYK